MKPFFNDCVSPMEEDLIRKKQLMGAMRELEEFKNCITSIVENYIKMIDTKISNQDYVIDSSVLEIRKNLESVATDILNNALNEGRITLQGIYDPETENLTIGGAINE